YTATVRNPMRLAVRMTRHAISPRLAINNLWKRRASDTITSFFSHALIFHVFFHGLWTTYDLKPGFFGFAYHLCPSEIGANILRNRRITHGPGPPVSCHPIRAIAAR